LKYNEKSKQNTNKIGGVHGNDEKLKHIALCPVKYKNNMKIIIKLKIKWFCRKLSKASIY
jgi:hypothetical protein